MPPSSTACATSVRSPARSADQAFGDLLADAASTTSGGPASAARPRGRKPDAREDVALVGCRDRWRPKLAVRTVTRCGRAHRDRDPWFSSMARTEIGAALARLAAACSDPRARRRRPPSSCRPRASSSENARARAALEHVARPPSVSRALLLVARDRGWRHRVPARAGAEDRGAVGAGVIGTMGGAIGVRGRRRASGARPHAMCRARQRRKCLQITPLPARSDEGSSPPVTTPVVTERRRPRGDGARRGDEGSSSITRRCLRKSGGCGWHPGCTTSGAS